jgi:hypothetical protein
MKKIVPGSAVRERFNAIAASLYVRLRKVSTRFSPLSSNTGAFPIEGSQALVDRVAPNGAALVVVVMARREPPEGPFNGHNPRARPPPVRGASAGRAGRPPQARRARRRRARSRRTAPTVQQRIEPQLFFRCERCCLRRSAASTHVENDGDGRDEQNDRGAEPQRQRVAAYRQTQ